MDGDGAGIPKIADVPDVIEQLLACKDLSWVQGQKEKQVKLFVGEI